MDIVILGIFENRHASILEDLAKKNKLQIIWDFDQYLIESEIGLNILKDSFKLKKIGILVDFNFLEDRIFSSYPLIYEISEFYIENQWGKIPERLPKLFNYLNDLKKSIINSMIFAFADEWYDYTTVKIESLNFDDIQDRLNNPFVWCPGYKNLQKNFEIRDSIHPLILEVKK